MIRWKLRELARLWDSEKDTRATDALKKVGIISMRGWPLYGPVGEHASYNTVPGQMPGWDHLWELVDEAKPLLIIIDPALTAFVGEANSANSGHGLPGGPFQRQRANVEPGFFCWLTPPSPRAHRALTRSTQEWSRAPGRGPTM